MTDKLNMASLSFTAGCIFCAALFMSLLTCSDAPNIAVWRNCSKKNSPTEQAFRACVDDVIIEIRAKEEADRWPE